MIGGISVMVLYYCVLKRTKGGKGRTFLFPGCYMMVIVLCVMKEDVKGWRLESVRVRNKQTNKQTNVTHIHGPVAAVNAHTLKASGSVTQLVSQLL